MSEARVRAAIEQLHEQHRPVEKTVFYDKDSRPVLATVCATCTETYTDEDRGGELVPADRSAGLAVRDRADPDQGGAVAMNREQAPEIWWSPMWGLMWSDDGERSYRRVEDGRVVEFLHMPAHARRLLSDVDVDDAHEAYEAGHADGYDQGHDDATRAALVKS